MNIKLIAHTCLSDEFLDEIYPIDESVGVNERAAVALTAIRTCYSPLKPTEILPAEGAKYFRSEASDGEGGTDADRLFRHIVRSKHTSTLEHITYTFAIEGVSRSLLAQLTRHRQFSFSVQSQRYNRYFREEISDEKRRLSRYQNDAKRNGKCRFTIGEERRIIDMYDSGMSTREIGRVMDACHSTINGVLTANGVRMRSGNEPVVNHGYFKNIDSHRKAQILGFLAADGSVGEYFKDGYTAYQIGAEVCAEDGYFLEGILHSLSSKNSVSHTARGTRSMCVISKQIFDDLRRYGITQNKTHSLDITGVIENISPTFLPSFLLGYFEGNGYVNKESSRNAIVITTGSSKAAEQVADIIKQNITDRVYIQHEENCFRVRIHETESIEKFLSWIYSGASLQHVLRRKLIKASKSYEGVNSWRIGKLRELASEHSFVLTDKLESPDATFIIVDYLNAIKTFYISMVANGIPQEDARAITGQGHKCNLVMTGNLRAYLEFYGKRRPGSGAQHEIANLAERIREEITKVDEWTAKFFEGSE